MPAAEDCLKHNINLLVTENGNIAILELHCKQRLACDGEKDPEGMVTYDSYNLQCYNFYRVYNDLHGHKIHPCIAINDFSIASATVYKAT